ncbi:MAG: cytochrome c [Bacteroidota bacterium]
MKIRNILYYGWPVLVVGIALIFYFQDRANPSGAGQRLYTTHCANCHMDNGQGLRRLIPPLAGADYVNAAGAEMACLIRNGIADTMVVNGVIYSGVMPGNTYLDEVELVAVLNYIKQSWGNSGETVTYPEVKKALSQCP